MFDLSRSAIVPSQGKEMPKVNSGYSFFDISMMPGVFGGELMAHGGPRDKDLKCQKWLGGSLVGPLEFPI